MESDNGDTEPVVLNFTDIIILYTGHNLRL